LQGDFRQLVFAPEFATTHRFLTTASVHYKFFLLAMLSNTHIRQVHKNI